MENKSKLDKLSLDSFRKSFNFTINYGLSGINGDTLTNKHGDTFFDFDVYLPSKGINLQRDFVWTDLQKEELILSILKGIKLPPVTLIQFKSKTSKITVLEVIDGKQRLSTIKDFISNKFPIIFNGWKYFYDDLNFKCHDAIRNCITANIGYSYDYKPISDEDKISWFEMINFAGTPQDIEHLNKLKS